ncbi:hypothetical protein [Sulfuricella sp. T08]|uniref:zinc ribbon-containing protein n=1 Tax=Sulfuricella sp. T08 TaxID=1632857 RepID=UPI0009E1F36D
MCNQRSRYRRPVLDSSAARGGRLGAAVSLAQGRGRPALPYRRHHSGRDVTCTQCGQQRHLKRTTKIPPCPSCHGTEFRKWY